MILVILLLFLLLFLILVLTNRSSARVVSPSARSSARVVSPSARSSARVVSPPSARVVSPSARVVSEPSVFEQVARAQHTIQHGFDSDAIQSASEQLIRIANSTKDAYIRDRATRIIMSTNHPHLQQRLLHHPVRLQTIFRAPPPIITQQPTLQRPVRKKPPIGLFEDSQNVHHVSVNENMLKIARQLLEAYPYSSVEHLRKPWLSDKVWERILVSHCRSISIFQVYQSLCEFIVRHPQSHDLEQRFEEEFKDVDSTICSTGFLDRFVNVVQSFDTRFQLVIDEKQYNYSRLKPVLDAFLQKTPDSFESPDTIQTAIKSLDREQLAKDHSIPLEHVEYSIKRYLNI